MHFSECIENEYASEPCERMPVRIGASGLELAGEQGGWLAGSMTMHHWQLRSVQPLSLFSDCWSEPIKRLTDPPLPPCTGPLKG